MSQGSIIEPQKSMIDIVNLFKDFYPLHSYVVGFHNLETNPVICFDWIRQNWVSQ